MPHLGPGTSLPDPTPTNYALSFTSREIAPFPRPISSRKTPQNTQIPWFDSPALRLAKLPPMTPNLPVSRALETTIFAAITLALIASAMYWLASSVFPPVVRGVTVTKLDKDCSIGGLFPDSCEYSAFDGLQLYDLTKAQYLSLEPGRAICMTSTLASAADDRARRVPPEWDRGLAMNPHSVTAKTKERSSQQGRAPMKRCD
jgi:hypothetical protein